MALPSGSMDSSDFPYSPSGSDPEYIYFAFRSPMDAKHYSGTSNYKNLHAECFTEIDVAASTTIEQTIAAQGLSDATTWYDLETGPDTDTWLDLDESPGPIDGATFEVELSDPTTHPTAVCGYDKFQEGGVGAGCGVHSIFIAFTHAESYDGERAELQPRGGTNMLYANNSFCSSYQMVFGLCETYNKLFYESRPIISFIP